MILAAQIISVIMFFITIIGKSVSIGITIYTKDYSTPQWLSIILGSLLSVGIWGLMAYVLNFLI